MAADYRGTKCLDLKGRRFVHFFGSIYAVRADQDQTLAKHFLTLATMNEKRSSYRRRLLKTGCIITSDKAPTIQCTVRNAADTGAALQVSTSFGIPGNFDVIIEGSRRRCRVLWRTDTMIGVSFEQVNRSTAA